MVLCDCHYQRECKALGYWLFPTDPGACIACVGLGGHFYSFIKTEMLKVFLLIPTEMLPLTRAPRELSYSSDGKDSA